MQHSTNFTIQSMKLNVIITNRVWIYKSTTEFKFDEKTNDSLASKPDVMMKPVHDVNHILRCTTWKTKPQVRMSILILSKTCKAFGLRGLFCQKAVKSRSLIAGFSFQVLVQLTILGEHLSNSIHGKNNYLLSSNQPNSSSSSSFTSYSMWQKG